MFNSDTANQRKQIMRNYKLAVKAVCTNNDRILEAYIEVEALCKPHAKEILEARGYVVHYTPTQGQMRNWISIQRAAYQTY